MHACDSCMVTTKCCGVVKGVIHPFLNAPLWEYDANLPIMLFINYVVIRSRAHTHTHTPFIVTHLKLNVWKKESNLFCERKHASHPCTTMMHMCVELDKKGKNLARS